MLALRRGLTHLATHCHISHSVISRPSAATPAASISTLNYLSPTGAKYVLGGLGVGATLLVASQTSTEDVRMAYLIPSRLARDVVTAAAILADYRWSLRGLAGDARQAEVHQCHQRSANRLLDLCFKNGGIYIKLGQHIGQLDHLLPEEYVVTMRNHLLDKCPISSWAEVRRIITQDLGAPPEQLFASFEHTPVASASLAQVHRATDKSGRPLAVKVQHHGLRETSVSDTATVAFLVRTIHTLYPDFDYNWLVDEINDNLPKELDFKHEAANAERCRQNLLKGSLQVASRVHVPEVIPELSSHRVLTMEFIDGVRVTDRKALQQLGIRPQQLAKLIAETFSEMIFIHGDVHCDPHAANMLVRKQNGRMQLVLLDHGLYKQIDDDFRHEYAALWRALIFGDQEGIKKHTKSMNAGDSYPIFAAMLTQRPWEQIVEQTHDHLAIPNSQQHRDAAHHFASLYAKEISDLLGRMPRALLMLLKTNDCLRSVDNCLGQPVNTFVITARQCTRALAMDRLRDTPGIAARCAIAWDVLRVEIRMRMLEAAMFFSWLTGAASFRTRRIKAGRVAVTAADVESTAAA